MSRDRIGYLGPLIAGCLMVLHSPDGQELLVDADHLIAVRPVGEIAHHFTTSTNSIIYLSSGNFGVIETPEQIDKKVKNCETGHGG